MTDHFPDDYYCDSCWEKREGPAPARCTTPGNHNRHEAVKVEIIVTAADGSSIHIMSDNFDYTEFEVDQPEPRFGFWHDDLLRASRPTPRDLILTVKRAKTYRVWQEADQPALEDPNVVDADEPQ